MGNMHPHNLDGKNSILAAESNNSGGRRPISYSYTNAMGLLYVKGFGHSEKLAD